MFKIYILCFALLLIAACAGEKDNGILNSSGGRPACTPNVIDAGLQIYMEPLSRGSNDYTITLCTNSQPSNAQYSVYGGINSATVDATQNPNLDYALRIQGITATNNAGNSFQVLFKPSDQYFAIYVDQADFHPMVLPHRIPGR